MTAIAVIAFAESPRVIRDDSTTSGVEMLVPIFREVFTQTGLSKDDIDFWCSGSSDYLAGRAFSFVTAVDTIGAFPPKAESHVEMDAAWALYEAWVKLLTGEAETALVYGFGKSSAGLLRRVMALQLDPYLQAPLWPDSVSIAAMQARLGIEAGLWSEKEMASIAIERRGLCASVEDLLSQPYVADPLRKHDCAPITDGAAAVILAAGDRARDLCENPAWITGFEHRIDSQNFGLRDLTTAPSAAALQDLADGAEVAELHAPFTHQEIILRSALALKVSPSGEGNPMFAAGLARVGCAAREIHEGRAGRVIGHATSGPALQQNLVCRMEAR